MKCSGSLNASLKPMVSFSLLDFERLWLAIGYFEPKSVNQLFLKILYEKMYGIDYAYVKEIKIPSLSEPCGT